MMNRSTVWGTLAIVVLALVQVTGGASFTSSACIDHVAEKLENHFQGVDLDDKITFGDCRAAVFEFELWDAKTHNDKVTSGPLSIARNYLDDFMYRPLRNNLDKYEKDENLAEEFIEKLESAYKKARSSYTFRAPLECGTATTRGAKTCALANSLAGKGELLSWQLISEADKEMDAVYEEMVELGEKGDIFQDVDKFLELLSFYNTPEVHVCAHEIMRLSDEEGTKEKIDLKDPSEIQKYMDTYDKAMANFTFPSSSE